MLKLNVILIDESPIYGGHESMFMSFLENILPQLLNVVSVNFVINSRNHKLIAQLKGVQFSNVIVHELTLSKLPIKPISQFLFQSDSTKIRSCFDKIRPALVLNIQGTIEIGCTTLRVCKSLDVPVISYLPITKSSAQLGVFLGGIRDYICKSLYYSIPKKIITISNTNSNELQNLFSVPLERISVVHNFVESPKVNIRMMLPEFALSKKHLTLVGRISNSQKQQFDFLSAWLASDLANDYVIHIVGDSDDNESNQLRTLCAEGVVKGGVVFHGWQSSEYVTQVIKQSDALLLPSRFEGVPLVMLEAIALGRIVLGSAVDGMKEFLPPEWTFEVGDWPSMFQTIKTLENFEKQDLLIKATQYHFGVFNKLTNTQKFLTTLLEELK
jgi:glycosyltransferase involved in cell wall biosynthesis